MKCPCEQCICMPICKCRIRGSQSRKTGTFSSILRCEILNNYLKRAIDWPIGSTKYRMRIDETRKIYGLRPLLRGRYIHEEPV